MAQIVTLLNCSIINEGSTHFNICVYWATIYLIIFIACNLINMNLNQLYTKVYVYVDQFSVTFCDLLGGHFNEQI